MSDEVSSLGDRRVTLEQLRAFVLIARGGGFNQAGAELHRTQSAVTQSLKRLEDILGCRLVERRQGHIVGLTADGKRFIATACEILTRTSEAVSAMQQPQISGRVRIGVPEDFRIVDLHEAISRCGELNRRLKIEVTSALSQKIAQLLEEERLDIAITYHISSDQKTCCNKRFHSLREEPLYWVGKDRREFASFAEMPLVTFPEECRYRALAIGALVQWKKPYYLAYVTSSYDNLRAAISAGLGVGILPKSAIGKDHEILGEADGFPLLPEVRLAMTEASSQPTVTRLGEFLRISTRMNAAVTDAARERPNRF